MSLVSDDYKKTLQKEHQSYEWGNTAGGLVDDIVKFANICSVETILDYGSGYGSFSKGLNRKYEGVFLVKEYDPGIHSKSSKPDPEDFVICIDVLEHVEPELLENVLDDLQRVINKFAFISINCIKASRTLSDGRNAHLIIQPPSWWKIKIEQRFDIIYEKIEGAELHEYRLMVMKPL